MILSASRRTDLPAHYAPWLMNRLRAGHVLVPHPRRARHFSRVPLGPGALDALVFWSKNPAPMLPFLPEIDAMGLPYYFQFTLTPYGPDIEPHLPPKEELLATFLHLADAIGPERVLWRYDPIVLSDHWSTQRHIDTFAAMARALSDHTRRVSISFLDIYASVRTALNAHGLRAPLADEMRTLAQGIAQAAGQWGLSPVSCCEEVDLAAYGIAHGSCIDAALLAQLGMAVRAAPAQGQRPHCLCAASVDIGIYDSCTHGCLYCYAVKGQQRALRNHALHDPQSELLFGQLPADATITQRAHRAAGQTALPL